MARRDSQKEILDRIQALSSGEDCGICPSPVSDRAFVSEIIRYFLGSGWYVTDPLSGPQVNHVALIEIESEYKRKKAYDRD